MSRHRHSARVTEIHHGFKAGDFVHSPKNGDVVQLQVFERLLEYEEWLARRVRDGVLVYVPALGLTAAPVPPRGWQGRAVRSAAAISKSYERVTRPSKDERAPQRRGYNTGYGDRCRSCGYAPHRPGVNRCSGE